MDKCSTNHGMRMLILVIGMYLGTVAFGEMSPPLRLSPVLRERYGLSPDTALNGKISRWVAPGTVEVLSGGRIVTVRGVATESVRPGYSVTWTVEWLDWDRRECRLVSGASAPRLPRRAPVQYRSRSREPDSPPPTVVFVKPPRQDPLGPSFRHAAQVLGYLVGRIPPVIIAALYFLPAIVGRHRHHRQTTGIFVLNLFLGWTFVGWVASLVWAVQAGALPMPDRTGEL